MDKKELKTSIISRMSTLSNTFKILAGTSLLHTDSKKLWQVLAIAALMMVMNIYYFYIEKYYRMYIEDPENEHVKWLDFTCMGKVLKSFSIWGYYFGLSICILLQYCGGK